MRSRRSYPKHAFPCLLSFHNEIPSPLQPLPNKKLKEVVQHIHQGARVLFDPQRRRAMLYRFSCGIVEMAQLTVRSLSILVKKGYLLMSYQEGSVVHYTPNPALVSGSH